MDKYKWDLTKMFHSKNDFMNTIDEINNLLIEIEKYKGKIIDNLEKVLLLDSHIDRLCEKVYVYSHLGYYENMKDKEFIELKEIAINTYIKSNEIRSFINPELLSCNYNNVIEIIKNNPNINKYELNIERLFRYKNYTLSEKEEKLLSSVSELLNIPENTYSILNNIDIKLKDIKDENGNKIKLTASNYGKMLSSKNDKVRKDAFN